ncbi:hypothetical protein [Acidovorax sp.]|uniref:hypothetical protein n=1 Tax=Acidovorax sp. TaxID=1872122 RepID=UPI0025B7E208|nr:hypothetical protein [Acidovorax sp.]MBW8465959.1 hypothetical protein [Acidovorax sp.]
MNIFTEPTSIVDSAQAALTALSRVGLSAAEDARRTNTYMVVEEDGKVLRESPEEYLRKRTEHVSQSSSKHSA